MHCPPSAIAESSVLEETSETAIEGTKAHAVCERMLTSYLTGDKDAYTAITGLADELKEMGIPADMIAHAAGYVDYAIMSINALQAKPDAIAVEERVELMPHIAPNLFGTCDLVLLGGGTLHVIDYKYGIGVRVDAPHNPQLMLYALGAAMRYQIQAPIERVRLSIYQPRINHTSEWEISLQELLEWANGTLYPAAKKAYTGEGERVAGDHCKFCRVKATCRTLATYAALSVLGVQGKDADTLDEYDISRVLSNAANIRGFLDSVEKYALDSAIRGAKYGGFKIVEGRSLRKITDPEGLKSALEAAGYAQEEIMRNELKTITALESAIGRDKLATLGAAFITKPAGAPQLVPENDKRPIYNHLETIKTAFADN